MKQRLSAARARASHAFAALGVFWWALLGSAQTGAGAVQEKRVAVFPAPGFDSQKIVQEGLKVTRQDGALVFDQELQGAWPKAILPVAVRLAGHTGLVVEAENLGKELLKIRFGAPGAVFPTEREALMRLPCLELEAGKKGALSIPLCEQPPLHKEVVRRLSGTLVPQGGSGFCPDTADRFTVFVYQTGQPRTFRITGIQAAGAGVTLPDYCSWAPERFFPCIDRFGQFKHADWSGKTRSEDDLKRALEQERSDLAAQPGPAEWNAYGGWAKGPKRQATGRFRVEKADGKWWFVDPEGALWWSHGVTLVTVPGAATPLEGRADFFERLPAKEEAAAQFYRTTEGGQSFDFAAANALLKYGDSWREASAALAQQRLRSWGLNTLGADCSAEVKGMRKMPYMERVMLSEPRVEGVGAASCPLIDPYHPEFKAALARQLAACAKLAEDTWCVGLGVDSGIGRLKLVALGRMILTAPEQQPAKRKMADFLKRKHGKIEQLNAAWKAAYEDWGALLKATNAPPGAAGRDCSEFAELFAEATFKGVASALKAAAPNTLNLGCLLYEADPILMRLAGWNADVVSVAHQGPSLETLSVSPYLEKPVLVDACQGDEPERGIFAPQRLEQAGGKARGDAYLRAVEAALRHPNVVGLHGVRYAEDFAAWEGGQDGLVDVCDTPRPALVAKAREAGARLYGMRYTYSLHASVTVDASKPLGARREIERYINNSILQRSPPPELAKVIEKEYGRARIVRCWVCLDDLWDMKSGAYNFNYPIKNRVKGDDADFEMPDIPFETYLTAFAGISDEVLLNVRRMERPVVEGRMTMAQWKEVCKAAVKRYKTVCPKLRYIEALNEFHLSAFGDLNTKEYYAFYRTFYEIVNELNAELKPELPLLVGGPATTGAPPDRHLREFVALYAADTAPAKRLDFLSYHYYGNQKWSEAAEFEKRMTELLDAHQIPSDIPMFWDEMGFTGSPWTLRPVATELNRLQATCVTAFQYYSRKNRKLHVLPWVTFHSPSQTALTQFIYRPDGKLQMTPFGMTVKCWGMQKKNEVPTESTGLREDGSGLGAMGSVDESGAAVLLWNHQALSCEVDLALTGLPDTARKGWRVSRYLVDSRHSNCYADLTKAVALETAEESSGSGLGVTRRFVMEPYAVSLLLIETAGGAQRKGL
jgi:hypothetical protein